MDSATILVLVLCAGVVALLVWFEINSHQNDAREKAESDDAETLPKKSQNVVGPKGNKKKAA